jgi:hypothetical protein
MHKPLPLGCIIGSVEIVEVTTTDGWKVRAGESEYWYEEHAFGDYSSGRFAWRLDKPICFKTPIPYKGELGIKDFKLMSVRQTPGITDTPEVEAMIREWTADIVKKKQHKLF